MKINIIGGGPAGLYLAYLVKRAHSDANVTVYERNSPNATYGFGVVLAEEGLKALKEADASSYDEIVANTETLAEQVIDHPQGIVTVDSLPRAGSISRLRLLQLLQARCAAVGVRMQFGVEIRSVAEVADASLVVAADGVNSAVRAELANSFGTTSYFLNNRFAWYGVERPYTAPTLAFRRVGHSAAFVAHYYRYSPTMSTFVVECDAATWAELKMDQMSEEQRRLTAEDVFRRELGDAPLIANNSLWRQFQVVRNETWSVGNVVLLGDAQRSMHFSIGSGTRMAMEDAVALCRAIGADRSPAEIMQRFEQLRRQHVRAFWQAALRSMQWYEAFAERLRLPPVAFAYDYMMRTGRMTDKRLQAAHPAFMHQYQMFCGTSSQKGEDSENA